MNETERKALVDMIHDDVLNLVWKHEFGSSMYMNFPEPLKMTTRKAIKDYAENMAEHIDRLLAEQQAKRT